jgi:hypothetical protein
MAMSRTTRGTSYYVRRRWATLVLERLEARTLPTMTSLTASANLLNFGQTLTLTATVTDTTNENGAPTGGVDFIIDGQANNMAFATAGTISAQATFTTSNLAVGAHSITATYLGGFGFGNSTSAALTETVLPMGTPPGFAGVGLQDELNEIPPQSSNPPDTMGAVGPTITINQQQVKPFVEMLNGEFVVYDLNNANTILAQESLDTFWGVNVATDGDAVDPHILFDPNAGVWLASAIDQPPPTNRVSVDNDLLFAVSKTSNPVSNSDWLVHTPIHVGLPAGSPGASGGVFGDYDTLGADSNGVYVGLTMISYDSQPVVISSTASILAAHNSASLFSGTATFTTLSNITDIDPTTTDINFSPQPALNLDHVAPTDPAWFVNSINRPMPTGMSNSGVPPTLNDVAYRTLTWTQEGSTYTPHLSATSQLVTTPDYGAPSNDTQVSMYTAPQKGAIDNPINADEDRLLMAVIRDDQLWTARTVGVDATGTVPANQRGDRLAAEFLELDVTPPATGNIATATYIQSGREFDTATNLPISYYYPSVMVNGAGYMAMGFTGSSDNQYPSAYVTSQLPFSLPGALQPVILVKAGEAAYTLGRWGDYSYTSLDPDDDTTIWTVQEYAAATASDGSSRWGTWITTVGQGVSMAVISSDNTVRETTPTLTTTLTLTALARNLAPGAPLATGSVAFMENDVATWDPSTQQNQVRILSPTLTDLAAGDAVTGTLFFDSATGKTKTETTIDASYTGGPVIPLTDAPLNASAIPVTLSATLAPNSTMALKDHDWTITVPNSELAASLLNGDSVTGPGILTTPQTQTNIDWMDFQMNPGFITIGLTHKLQFGVSVQRGSPQTLTFTGSNLAFTFATATLGTTGPVPTATFTTFTLLPLHHLITAAYIGNSADPNANYPASPPSSPPFAQTVNADGIVHINSSTPSSAFGQMVTFSVSVTAADPADGTPTGLVTFEEGGVTLATDVTLDDSGLAIFATSALGVGSHTITAVYGGDDVFADATADNSVAPQVVNQASSAVTVSSAPNSSLYGQVVTFTAAVSARSSRCSGRPPRNLRTVILKDSGTEAILLPPRSPNLNAHVERFWRSLRGECLDRLIFFGESALRRATQEFVSHYHAERNHQGLFNRLIEPSAHVGSDVGEIRCRQRAMRTARPPRISPRASSRR